MIRGGFWVGVLLPEETGLTSSSELFQGVGYTAGVIP